MNTQPAPSSDIDVNVRGRQLKNGLAQLALALIRLLYELLEQQAIRRMDAGELSDAEVDRLGLALLRQAEEIERMCRLFNLTEEDLNLDLGPLGKLF